MNQTYEYIVNLSGDLIALIDRDYRYVLANDSYCLETGFTREKIIGSSVSQLWGADEFERKVRTHLDKCFTGRQEEYFDTMKLGGIEKPVRVTFHPYADEAGETTHVLAFIHEVRVRSEVDVSADDDGHRDRLTGLFNRRTLESTIAQQLAQARRSKDHPVRVLLFLSFRNFKSINRTHGHQIGDILLENSAIRVTECLRTSDIVFRFDGANFVVLLTEIERETDAGVVARKIQEAVSVPYRFHTIDLRVDCYIGIGIYPRDAEQPDTLIQVANSACIEAEERGESFLFYDKELHQQAVSRVELHTQLQRAFESDEFQLYYQPIADISGSKTRIVGAEALLRWQHPDRGLLSPGSFLRLAEETRVVLAIDKWALFTVCETLADVGTEYDITISVNVSSASFADPNFTDVLRGALEAAGNPDPARLRIELTESMSVDSLRPMAERVEELEELGIELWIDDFGVGQSSLSVLKVLPAHGVKIDRSFADEIEESEQEQSYLASILESVRARNKKAIIEGVSTTEKLQFVQTLNCSFVQGFAIGHPVPFRELLALLSRRANSGVTVAENDS